MTPQQREIAQAFLNNPNREEALNVLLKQYGINQQQVEQFKNSINLNG